MNILLISSRSDMGGGPRHLYDIAKELKNYSSINVFICAPVDHPYGDLFKENSADFFPIKHRSFSFFKFLSLIIWSKKNNIQIVHSHGRGAGLYSRLMKLFGFKVAHSFHGIHKPETFKEHLKLVLEKIFVLLTDKIIFIGQDEKIQFELFYGQSHAMKHLIPNGINCDVFQAKIIPSTSRSTNNIVLGVLSRLDQHKGIHFLVKVMKLLEPHYILKIAGGGPDEDKIRELIQSLSLQDRVNLIGQIDSPANFLNEIDILVSNSKSEGMPYSVLEALCLEKRLLLSNVPGHQQFSDYASLFEKDNEPSFIKQLSSLKNSHQKPHLWNSSQMCQKLVSDIYVK